MDRLNRKNIDRISNHPIFKGLLKEEQENIYHLCKQKNYKKSEVITGPSEEGLHLLLEGNAEVYVTGDSKDHFEVLEVIQPGELIGLSKLAEFLGEPAFEPIPFSVEVRAVDHAVTFFIPFSVLEERWKEQEVRDYLLRKVTIRLKNVYSSLAEQVKLSRQWGESDPFIQRVQDLMTSPVISVNTMTTIQETAEKMGNHSIGSILVMDENILRGIVTESDLVKRVLSKSLSDHEPVIKVMTKNPYTVSRYDYYYQAMSEFLLRGVKHLPVMDQDQVVGMLSLSDLLRKKNYNMVDALLKIDQTDEKNLMKAKESIYYVLGTLLQNKVPILHTLELLTTLYDRLAVHILNLAVQSLELSGKGKPPVPFSWYQMGSAGRGEQFLVTDQDHFLVYDNSESKDEEMTDTYFASLGQQIVYYFEKAGYQRCKGNMMASEPVWRGSIKTWEKCLQNWSLRATNDDLLLVQNFLSFRFVYGSRELHDHFIRMLKGHFSNSKISIYRLAQMEQNHQIPILENLIRSLFGLNKKQLNLKTEALFPFHHALQIMAVHQGIVDGTPLQKIYQLLEKKLFTERFAEDLENAFEKIMNIYVNHRWVQHLRQEEPTSTVHFTHLGSKEKEHLIQVQKTFRTLQIQMLSQFALFGIKDRHD